MADRNWLFSGFFSKIGKEDQKKEQTNQIAPSNDNGAIQVSDAYDSHGINLNWTYNTQAELIDRYRQVSNFDIVDYAIDDIVNETVSFADDEDPIELDLSDLNEELGESTKEKFHESWDKISNLLDLQNTIHRRVKRFYIDGRASYQKVVETNKLSNGIKRIIELDPRYVTYIQTIEYDEQRMIINDIKETFVYDESVYNKDKTETNKQNVVKKALNLDPKSVSYITSGLIDSKTGFAISWLHKAIKPANLHNMMESALVIYRITRAPERRLFYVDVSDLPKNKGLQYLQNLKNAYKNKMSFNPEDGSFKDQRHLQTMQEDFWLPRSSTTGKGTEVTTLPGGQNLSDIEDVLYFQKKLYRALNVPLSRLEPESTINFGRQTEISRDELKLSKLVSSVRKRLNMLFIDLLGTDLVLRNIVTDEEWQKIKPKVRFKYSQDLYLEEMKKTDLLMGRLELLNLLRPFVGTYYSQQYVKDEVLKQTEEEQKKIKEDNEKDPPPSEEEDGPNF